MTIKQQGGIFGRNPTFNDIDVDSSINLKDGVKLNFGDSDDLVIQHQGSYSIIEDKGTGNLLVKGTNLQLKSYSTNEMYIEMTQNGAVDLYHNGVKQAYTSSVGLAFPSGKGIDFSATSGTGTSELFDDYEEGTWTPAFSATGLSGVTIGGGTAGYYTKVGNKVIAWFVIYTTGTFTKGSAALFIAGLPYTSANNVGGQGAVSFHNTTRFDALPPIAARVDSNSTSIKLYSSINATGAGTDPVAVSSSNMRSAAAENCNFVSGTVTYMV